MRNLPLNVIKMLFKLQFARLNKTRSTEQKLKYKKGLSVTVSDVTTQCNVTHSSVLPNSTT